MIKWTVLEWKKNKVPQKSRLNMNSLDTLYESQGNFFGLRKRNSLKKINQKQKMSFSSSTIIQFTIWEHFLQKAQKSVEINTICTEVAQQMKLSGCPRKGHFTVKSSKNAFLTVKWPLVVHPDNSICWGFISIDLHALNCKMCSQMVNWI